MPVKNPAALAFLQNRRSRPAKTLVQPVPDRSRLRWQMARCWVACKIDCGAGIALAPFSQSGKLL